MADEINQNKNCRIIGANGRWGDYTLVRFGVTTRELVGDPETVETTQPATFSDPIFQASRSRTKVTESPVHYTQPQQIEPQAQRDMSRVQCHRCGFKGHYARECDSPGPYNPPRRKKVFVRATGREDSMK